MGTNDDWERFLIKAKSKRLTRSSAIRNYCKLECCAGDFSSWKNCTITNCFLWRFRLGKETLAKPKSFQKHRKKPSKFIKNEQSEPKMRGKNEQSRV